MKNFEKFLVKHKYDKGPVDIVKIIEEEGVVIDYVDSGILDGLCVQVEGAWHILCKRKICKARKRFTLAHELKHYLERENAYAIKGQMRKKIEREANRFAGRLLVPGMALSEVWNKSGDIKEVAKYFKVSSQVIKIRLSDLGIKV